MNREHDPTTLTGTDCFLLRSVFLSECARLFPVPAEIRLDWNGPDPLVLAIRPEEDPGTSVAADQRKPVVQGRALKLPLALSGPDNCCFHLISADPKLLARFSASWLTAFQEKLQAHLQRVRLAYIDPETGLYNQRALDLFLADQAGIEASLFLVSIGMPWRRTKVLRRRTAWLTGLLRALAPGILFSLGPFLYGILAPPLDTDTRTRLGHRLQVRLKREGVARVRLASAPLTRDTVDLLDGLAQALDTAEERGPYGACDIVSLSEPHPFDLAPPPVMKTLRGLWRGVERFALVRLRSEEGIGRDRDPAAVVTGELARAEHLVPGRDGELFLFLPGVGGARAAGRAADLAGQLREVFAIRFAAGIGWFPCLRHNKSDVVRDCGKALLHGQFYGPDAVVVFDHLRCIVSGDWYFDQGDYRRAVREYRDGLALKPGDLNLLNSLGVALMEMNQHRQALDSFRQVLASDPDNYMALANLGYVCQMRGQDDEALEYLEKALQVRYHEGGEAGELYPHLGRLYCRLERFAQALRILEQWEKNGAGRKEYLLYRLMGTARLASGDRSQAIRALHRALALYPHDPESLSMLGLLYVLEGEGDEAGLSLLHKSIEMDGARPASWLNLARALRHLGQPHQALEAIRTCRRLDRLNRRARREHARILAACGHAAQARRMLSRLERSGGAGKGIMAAA